MTAFPRLLAPGRIGSLELRNRILMCPMGDLLGDPDGSVSQRQAAYYEARARGGAALLLVGSVAVAYPEGSYDTRQVGISDDRFLPGLADLARRAHAHGAAIAPQLVHDGAASLADAAAGRPRLVPSPPAPMAPDRLSRMVTPGEADAMMRPFVQPTSTMDVREATEDDLAWVIERFVDATRRARDAGFDGVELHAGHGYLIDSFLSPASNRRTDRWGGDVKGRARLLVETVTAIRAEVGDGFPLWCRFNAVEHFRPGGETIDDALAVAALAVEAGVDALHVSAYADPAAGLGVTEAHTPSRPGALLEHAGAVKGVVDVPVITFGRLEPEQAEAALAAGQADFVAMGRKLLADPDLPRKLAAGGPADVRPCIYQYRCIGNIFIGENVACVVNAATGHDDLGRAGALPPPRRVLVIGGGPGGLEAARVLAGDGHAVALWEGAAALGGRLAIAGLLDPQLQALVDWLVRQVAAAGVDVSLGREAAVDNVVAAGYDEVVVATGAAWEAPAGCMTVDRLRPWLVEDDGSVGRRVVVLGGGRPALSVAALCADRGRQVTVVADGAVLAPELGLPGRFRLVHEVGARGVELVSGVQVLEVGPDGIRHSRGSVECDTVIGASPGAGSSGLGDALAAAGAPVWMAGDCRSPRGVEGATADAAMIAAALSA